MEAGLTPEEQQSVRQFIGYLKKREATLSSPFLNAADEGTAAALATRIRDSISQNPVRIPGGATVTVHTTVIVMSVPRDGCSLTDALRAAKTRTDHLANKYHGSGPSVH